VGGSCNPAFIELGKRLGKDKFFEYVEAFGFGKPTGIDYPGESAGASFSSRAARVRWNWLQPPSVRGYR
jgi:stage V sporulation protein D (sporulation-specific penicillin-binding protein)